jgi:hypothetical protein
MVLPAGIYYPARVYPGKEAASFSIISGSDKVRCESAPVTVVELRAGAQPKKMKKLLTRLH